MSAERTPVIEPEPSVRCTDRDDDIERAWRAWPTLSPCERVPLLRQARQWGRGGGADLCPASLERLAETAWGLCDWPLLCSIADRLTGLPERGALYTAWYAYALLCLGDLGGAWELSLRASLLDTRCSLGPWVLSQVRSWGAYCDAFPFGSIELATEGCLGLVPLGPHHFRDRWWQMDDPDIADLCCLPVFQDERQWWRNEEIERARDNRQSFAVMHQDWGMIGEVALSLFRGVGFMYYWIGTDFRGVGFGSTALSLLMYEAVRLWGMETCYAKVFRSNLRSQSAMRRAGFLPIQGEILPERFGGEHELIFRWGLPASERDAFRDFRALMRAMKTPGGLVGPGMMEG
jgi:RimJ/RimL family protein N-acetyltransferase